ncbi:ABC transporter substrate-binding protein [Streptomyces xantholiticus]|uniref:ABC transporter substrate-binding protein n=1 Tax=Streptomyces xantholiticus TaxID=68285 RepID=UPI0016782E27|nr:ABC transporter substrate-binding protein [Streptomyces xantholiticus]
MSTGDQNSRVPAYPGVERFVDAFDKLVVQPRRTRSRVPVVLLSEPDGGMAGRRIVGGLRTRLRGREGRLAPHACVPAAPVDPAEGPLDLFEQITFQLDESMPQGTGRLRLPSYRLLRAVVGAPAAGGLMERRPKELRDHCYAEHREVSGLARGLWWLGGRDQANGGTLLELLWNFIAGPLFQRLPRALYGRRAGRRMLGRGRSGGRRWYAEWVRQQQGTLPAEFFRSALDLVGGGPDGDPEQLDRILVHALLADLEAAGRKRLLDPWRRRRVSRFVLLVEEAGPAESRNQRFLRELRSAMEDLRCTSVVAVAAGVRSLASRIPDIEVAGLSAAGADLANIAQRGTPPGRPSGMVVPVAEGPEDDQAATYWLGRWPTLAPPTRRWGPGAEVAGVLGAGVLALAVTAGLLAGVPFSSTGPDPCLGSTFLGTDGQCVGVAEGAASFGTGDSERAVRDVLQRIEQQNEQVEAELAGRGADDPRPRARTVVYFGPLSGGKDAEDPVRGGTLAELRGLALAQAYVNGQALRSGERVPLRVLAANAGDRFKDAPAVARRIVDVAERDRSIVGVVGFGQSRRRTYEAMRIFDDAGLPMVGTSGTADELLRQGEHYYQTAPTDTRAGKVMASFAEHAPMVDGRTAVRVRLVSDPSDAYSASLAAAFRDAYGNERTGLLLYTPTDAPEPSPLPGAPAGTSIPSVEDLAREVCRAVAEEPRTAVVWAGRGSHFQLFLNELARDARDCQKVSVLGGDDVTNALTEERRPWQVFGGLTLYYLSHGRAPALAGASREAAAFLAAYDGTYAKDHGTRTGEMRQDAHVALAWDAMRYLAEGIDQAWRGTGGHDERLDRGRLQAVLYQGLGLGFDGATGRIDAHGAAGGGRLTEQKLTAVEQGGPTGARTVLLCGTVARGDLRGAWGEGKHPCP